MSSRLCIVGAGRVGTALAVALGKTELAFTHVAARALPERLDAGVYLLCVRDPQLAAVAKVILARHEGPSPIVLHTAGGVPSSVLRDAGVEAAAVLHPLVAFAGGPPALAGALFAIEGDARARTAAEGLVVRLGGRPVLLDAVQLVRYHAAAVLASNNVLALVDEARAILVGLGIEPALAARGLGSLLGGVAANVADPGLPQALTGPIARGDVEAVRRHLAALADAPVARALYLATASRLVEIARAKGAADETALSAVAQLLRN